MRVTFVAVLVLLVAHGAAQAYGSEYEQATLRGVDSIHVVVHQFRDVRVRDLSLTEEALSVDIELRLRQAGLTVHPDSDVVMYLTLSFAKVGEVGWAYSLSLDLVHIVALVRDPLVTTPAATWTYGGVGWFTPENAKGVRELLSDALDAFESDYIAACQAE